jgi:5'-nucleotidase
MLATANFPIVSGNTRIASGHPLGEIVRDRVVIESGGVKVGVLGVTTPETALLSSPGDAVTFADPVTNLSEATARLRAEGVRNIIVLSHLGLFHDRLLAGAVDGISLIVGGHSHTFMSNVEPGAPRYATLVASPSGRATPIVQAYAFGRYLGDLTVEFDEDGAVVWARGEPIELTSEAFVEAPDVADRVAALAKPIAKLRETPVSMLAASIDASRDNCRTRECEMGNTVAEAMLSRVAASGVTIAIANGGGMRASLAAGEVTLDDIFGVLPFQNTLFTMELTGAQITAALEQGVSRFEIRTGSFPQIAGLRIRFNPLVFAGRSRITEVNVQTQDGWAPIDPAASYSVVVSNFMAAGGDGYSALIEGRNRYDTAIDMADALAEFLSHNAPFAPRLDGRIAR